MQFSEYERITKEGAKLVDEGKYLEAIQSFQSLLDSDISDIDKSFMAYNIAVTCEKMGHRDETLAWYDHAIAYEQPYCRSYITEQKAAYLANNGYPADSLALYEWLYQQNYVQESDKERIWNNICILKNPRE
jgi:tetratricopeptide (TPR) repeat protein